MKNKVYLVDFLLGVVEQSVKVFECVVIKDNLCLIVGAGDNVANSSQRCRNNFDLLVTE